MSGAAGGSANDTNISFNVLDDASGVVQNSIDAYVDGDLALSNSTFISPFDGPNSSISVVTIDGYDGYNVVLDRSSDFIFEGTKTVRVLANDAYGNTLDDTFTFDIATTVLNALYYSDAYGLHKINLSDLAGESQLASTNLLSFPEIPTNSISFIDETLVDGYFMLSLSYNDDYGVDVYANERFLNRHSDGYNCDKAQINSEGTLYLINKTTNQIEVYYGVNSRNGTRNPDYIYDGYSTPSLFNNSGNTGTLLSLHLGVSDNSTTRLYVGQSIGMTIIDTVDTQTNGYSDGYESMGTSISYGISGSGATYENIGGTDPQVIDINTDSNIVFVVTNNGITQIKNGQRLIHMTKENEYLPSNDVRKISPT